MLGQDILQDLSEVALGLERITVEHGKCLACHCYREVAEELLVTLETVEGHGELFGEPLPEVLLTEGELLRRTLASSEGKHG